MIYSDELASQCSQLSDIAEQEAVDLDEAISNAKPLRFDILVRFFNRFSSMRGVKKSNYAKEFIRVLFKSKREPKFTYGVLRLLLPADDRERGNYGLKEKTIARIVYESLSLKKEDYERLQHYKNPSFHQEGVGIGDFSLCLEDVVKKYSRGHSELTIDELNGLLTELAGSSQNHVTAFRRLFTRSNAEELKWITRIILKDLKMSLRIETVLNAFHKDAHEYFNLTNSLLDTCTKFQHPGVSLLDEIQLFSPISPMLAARQKTSFFRAGQPFYVETKFDGERLQVHKSFGKVQLFSRNAVDYTIMYGSMSESLGRCVEAQCCILDGEIIVLEKGSLKMAPFGLNKAVATSNQEDCQLCYMVFDLLWLKEDEEELNLMKYPLERRKQLLSKIIKQERGKVELVCYEEINEYDAILKRFSDSIERSEEGIMLKDPKSVYTPKERGWFKLKGDYVDGLTDTLDLIILGGYYGDSSSRHGDTHHWTDQITSFLLGVIERIDQLNPKIAYAIPFAKVGTGYSKEDLRLLREKLKPYLIRNQGKAKPPFLQSAWKHSLQDRPDCYMDSLSHSLLLEIKAAEIIHSDSYPTGYTLRFPRVVKARADKDWNEGLSLKDLKEMLDSNVYCKNMKRKLEEESDEEIESRKGTKKIKEEAKRLEVLDQFRGYRVSDEKPLSHLFNGLEFAVLPIPSKLSVERDILLNGGSVVQNPLFSTSFIVCEIVDFRLRAYASEKDRRYTFIKPLYIRNCINGEKLLPLTPFYLTALPERDAEYYREQFDKFGDSYTLYLNSQELNDLLEIMQDHYLLNPTLDAHLGLNFRRKGKVSVCLGVTRQDVLKLRANGNKVLHPTTHDTQLNSLILGSQLTPKDTQELHQLMSKWPAATLEWIEQIQDQGAI